MSARITAVFVWRGPIPQATTKCRHEEMVQPLVLHEGLPAGITNKQGLGLWSLPSPPSLLAVGQHSLLANNPLAKSILKRIILLTFLNMTSNCHADDLRDWLAIDSCDQIQFLCLVSRQSNCHCFDSLHDCIVGVGVLVVNMLGGLKASQIWRCNWCCGIMVY